MLRLPPFCLSAPQGLAGAAGAIEEHRVTHPGYKGGLPILHVRRVLCKTGLGERGSPVREGLRAHCACTGGHRHDLPWDPWPEPRSQPPTPPAEFKAGFPQAGGRMQQCRAWAGQAAPSLQKPTAL